MISIRGQDICWIEASELLGGCFLGLTTTNSLHQDKAIPGKYYLIQVGNYLTSSSTLQLLRTLQLVRRFLDPRFDPNEDVISSLDHAPDVDPTFQHTSICLRGVIMRLATVKWSSIQQADWRYTWDHTFESVECLIVNVDLMEFDGLADEDSVRSKYGIDKIEPLQTGSHTLLLLKNKACLAERLKSGDPNDSFSGSNGLQEAMDFIAKSITGRDTGHSFADWDVMKQDMDLEALHDTLWATLNDIVITRQLASLIR